MGDLCCCPLCPDRRGAYMCALEVTCKGGETNRLWCWLFPEDPHCLHSMIQDEVGFDVAVISAASRGLPHFLLWRTVGPSLERVKTWSMSLLLTSFNISWPILEMNLITISLDILLDVSHLKLNPTYTLIQDTYCIQYYIIYLLYIIFLTEFV